MKPSLLSVLSLILFAATSVQAQPRISDISLRGVQIGGTTRLTLRGTGLKPGTRLFFPFDVNQQVIEQTGSDSLTVELTLDESVRPGHYPLRAQNEDGISPPILLGVDRLPDREFSADPQDLPVAMTGQIAGARILKTRFGASQGELVILEIEANRLGSQLRPVIQVYDARGKLVAMAQPSRFLGGDARCFLEIPADGTYDVELHDFLFRGASPGFFRLKIGKFEYADLTLPVAIEPNRQTAVRMIKLDAESEFLEEVESDQYGWWKAGSGRPDFSGPQPTMLASPLREYVETSESDEPHVVGEVPVGINGRISQPKQLDRYQINVQPLTKLRLDLLGQRLGSPIDARLRVLDPTGKVLAENDDRPGQQDALLDFTVPENITQLVLEVSDVSAQGSKSHVYRLSVTHQDRPGLSLSVDSDTINIPRNGRAFLPVRLERSGYSGPVELLFRDLPETFEVTGTTIPAGSDIGLVTLAIGPTDAAWFSIQGRIEVDGQQRYFDALGPETPFAQGLSVQRKQLAVGVASARTLAVEWNQQAAMGLEGFLGGTLTPGIQLVRGPEIEGPVRVRLVTNQKTPKKRIRENNQDRFVDDIEKTLRADELELPADATASTLNLIIPNEIAEQDWEILLVAEVLSADKKQVLLATATRPIRLSTARLANVRLQTGKLLTLAKSGTTAYTVTGTIERPGQRLPCRISLAGLPQGVTVPPQEVAAATDEFNLTFELPDHAELRKLKSLDLVFSFFDEANPDRTVGRAKDQSVKVKVEEETQPDGDQPGKSSPEQ